MSKSNNELAPVLESTLATLREARRNFQPTLDVREFGKVKTVSAGIATVSGLPGVGCDELLSLSDDLYGIAFNLDEDEVGVVLLGACIVR